MRREHRGRLGDRRGFTLIETLVALAVLGTVMSVVYGMVSDQLRRISRGDEQVTLALFAENLLARTSLDLGRPGAPTDGSTADGLRWTIERTPVPLPPLPPQTTDPSASGAAMGAGSATDGGSSAGGAGSAAGTGGSLLPQPTPETAGTASATDGQAGLGEATTGGATAGSTSRRKEPQLIEVRVTAENARGERVTLTTLHVEAKP